MVHTQQKLQNSREKFVFIAFHSASLRYNGGYEYGRLSETKVYVGNYLAPFSTGGPKKKATAKSNTK
jgi:hypothetical protein